MKNILLLVLLGFVTFVSCKKDNFETFTPHTGGFETKTITASFSGIIVDENKKGLQAVTVTHGNNTTTTDENGVFFFTNIPVTNSKAYFKASKSGYFNGSRTLFAQANKNHQIKIKMLPNNTIGTINNASGGVVILPQGGQLKFDAGDVALPNGSAYTGMINVSAHRIDPTERNGQFEMPGDLRGIDSEEKNVVLQSYGMMAVELRDNAGNLLQVAPGQTVDMTFEIPETLLANAKEVIPLWYFDEGTGDWKEEGSATLSGNTYQGAVSHFSFWNCDVDFPSVYFEATFVDEGGNPIANQFIRLSIEDGTSSSGLTNDDGWIGGLIPANQILKMSILTECGIVYIQDVTTTTVDLNLGTITLSIDATMTYELTGTLVNCDNEPVAFGYLQVLSTNWFNQVPILVNADNNFTFIFTTCDDNNTIAVIGYDYENFVQSEAVGFMINQNTDLGNIQACGTTINDFYTINFTSAATGADTTVTAYPPNIWGNIIIEPDSTTMQLGIEQGGSGSYFKNIIYLYKDVLQAPATYEDVWGYIQQGSLQTYYKSTLQITLFPDNVGDYIEGTIQSNGTTPIVTGSFKFKRTQ